MTHDDRRLARLERHIEALAAQYQDVLEQLAEANLRIRFALSLMRVQKRSASKILDPSTNAPKLELTDGYGAYLTGGREVILAAIEREMRVIAAHLERQERDHAAPSTSPGLHEAGTRTSAPPGGDTCGGSSALEDPIGTARSPEEA